MDRVRQSIRTNRRRRTNAPLFGQLLTAAVESAADAVAVRFNPTGDPADQRESTYREFDEASSRLARVLIGRGCEPGAGVAVRLDRGVDWAVAAWAVLKAGAALVLLPAHEVPDAPTVPLGLTTGANPNDRIEWLRLDDAAISAEIAAQSPRPVTHANRTGVLSGSDPALVIGTTGVRMSYDELATAADHLRVRTGLTFESRTFQHGWPDSAATLLEVVSAGATGASLVVVPNSDTDLGESLAEEWVTHLIADRAALAAIDTVRLTDLRAVVLEEGTSAEVDVPELAEIVPLNELLPVVSS